MRRLLRVLVAGGAGLVSGQVGLAQAGPHQFPIGRPERLQELPAAARLPLDLERLPVPAQERALRWLQSFHFSEFDLPALRVDGHGGILYACAFGADPAGGDASEPPPAAGAAVPVDPFPEGLIFHSRPGAPNVLYLNFAGEVVANTEWNTVVGRSEIPALAFSTDSDLGTFSDAEQAVIRRIWQRVAEDYAAFDLDVTTERPSSWTSRTAHALLTRSTDTNGDPNPYNTAGGVAYVNVFGSASYAAYRPAWIYHNNLGNNESYIAEAASHEIGHNLGLSHDGRTDGVEYYGGHGTGDISWGPIMGTGYNRNVTQWCQGEYYLANNTQDDLATIAGKTAYRADDCGNTPGAAAAVVVTGGTNIVSTTPETDPANDHPANKGVLERTSDVDVFSLVTGTGPIRLSVQPRVMPSGTRGGNVDLSIALTDASGAELAADNPPTGTAALIERDLPEGRYYLLVRSSGAGDPFASSPSGYTQYGSVGQYFISGYLTESAGFIVPPVAELAASDLTDPGEGSKSFAVTYSDDAAIDVSSIDGQDIRVTGPNGYDQLAQVVSLDVATVGTPRTATYAVTPPGGGTWAPADNGTYAVFMRADEVADTEGAFVAAGELGGFQVAVPTAVYTADLEMDPGWTLEPQWEYGIPAYDLSGPSSGFTGSRIIAYNLDGDYANRLSMTYATTGPIDCSGISSLTLRFQRWLRLKSRDTAVLEASTNGTTWVTLWSSSSAISDTGWRLVQYDLPPEMAGSASVRLRWGIGSNQAQTDIGWNLDDIEVLGDGVLDSQPPQASLSVADITTEGSPSQGCSVSYTDETAVRLASLDSLDLSVTGPNGYSNLAEFVGADLPTDGSPITGSYSVPAPGGTWDAGDNGTYTIILLEAAVEDTLNNAVAQAVLGTFNVAISTLAPGLLAVSPAEGLDASGREDGPFSPVSASYTLSNQGESPLSWTAEAPAAWTDLSMSGGSLAPGNTTNLAVSLNALADELAAGSYTDVVSILNASTGQGSTTRTVTLSVTPREVFELTVTVNEPTWGTVNPSNGSYAAGTVVEVEADPATYFQFEQWAGDAAGTDNPLAVHLDTNCVIVAWFGEVCTTNYPTPYWWLASYGYTNDFESAVTNVGANQLALWESYLAGLDPTDPNSRLRLEAHVDDVTAGVRLEWNTVSGRVYTVYAGTNLVDGLSPLPEATDLPWDTQGFTDRPNGQAPRTYYGLKVRIP